MRGGFGKAGSRSADGGADGARLSAFALCSSECTVRQIVSSQSTSEGLVWTTNDAGLYGRRAMTGTGLPLDGVRVVEMTHMVMGPTCGMILAQLGAEVIKVEPPAGDKTRSLGGMGTSFFPLFNRGKRSVVLDFAKAEDRDTMHRLLASADVFLENFRDGQLDKQGLGPEELRRKHPHLIVAGHKGFLSGPYEHRPALDEVVQMMSGLAAMTGTREKPQRVGSSANDIMGGMFGAIAILAALYQKRGGNKDGADIRIGLFENCLFLVAQHMVEYEMTGRKPRSMPEREHAWPIYDIFDTAGGERIFIGVVTEGHWQSFCREFGLQEFADDPTLRNTTDRILARGENHSACRRGDQGAGTSPIFPRGSMR